MTPTQAKIKTAEILKKQKVKAETLAENNRARVRTFDGFADIDKRARALIIEISKNEFMGKNSTPQKLELNKLNEQKNEIYKKLNLTEADLNPQYSCKICNDTGFVDGKPCACYTKQVLALLSENQHLENFDNFSYTREDDNLTKYLEKAVRFSKSWANNEQPFLNVLINGQVGTGKTFLGECILSECAKKGQVVYKISAFAMNELFTKFHTTFDYSKQDYLTELLDCDALLIDDLGTEPIKRNVTLEYLLLILSERENANKKTIITTNLNQDQIREIYQERIFSRLCSKTKTATIKLSGQDLRLK